MDAFSLSTRRWFTQNFDVPTEVQVRGWAVIASGRHALITAPTGSGKTLAAFLWAIDRLMQGGPTADTGPACIQVLYVSPLKALVYDIERNLRAPLAGIARAAEILGVPARLPRVGIRTGDTPAKERQRQLKEPPEILVTTPESLYLLLGSKAAANLAGVHTLIIDEVHALAPTKRGAHLALSLERLAERCASDPQRIGLSATVRPLAEAALYLGGDRAVEIVDAAAPPKLDLRVQVPVPDMERPPEGVASRFEGGSILGELYRQATPRAPAEKGLWSAIHPAILAEIRAHRSTIVFVNSRGLCERLCQRLNALAEADLDPGSDSGPDLPAEADRPELVRAHHGSVSLEQRTRIEEGLKRGDLKAIVATSSLEMGIDMGGVDQVLLVESPGSVARGLQRVGRAGHGVGQVSTGRIFPKFRGDLLECAVIGARMLAGELEPFRMPRNALDVLAQQIAAHCVETERSVADLHRLASRAGPYRELSRSALEAVLDMLSGRYPSSDFAELKPLLVWDRTADTLGVRKGTAMITRLNAGTIPDRGNYAVHLGEDGPRIGELDEEMVFETKAGDCVLLGASTWRVEAITRDRVLVSPAPGEPGKLPFWRGDGPGRPVELGRAVGAFTRAVAAIPAERAADWIREQTPSDALAAANLAAYIQDQRTATGQVPSDRTIVVERFRDELGDWRICILTPFGARIHAPWAMALQWHLGRREGFEIQVMYTDDGIVLRFADGEALPELTDLLPAPEDLDERVTEQLADTALFASLFRENAARALLLPRRSAKGRQPLWAQRLKAHNLLAVVRRYPAFPIVLETYRQALGDVFDLAGLKDVLSGIRNRSIRVHEVETRSASPFARSLVFAYVAAYIYEQDAPLAERRAQALTLDRGLLAELLGQAELRELIDPAVLDDLERELQHTVEGRKARDADELHDLLRRLGDLSSAELAERAEGDPSPWLATLVEQRRAVALRFIDGPRWIAAEDVGLYRDALGLVPPPGLPDAFLMSADAPLEHLLHRYARTHGPFPTRDPAARYGLRATQLEPVLRLLETRDELIRGEIRPLGTEPEWCDPEVLRRLRRRTLAKARDAVAPVDAATLGRFLPAWHGIGEDIKGPDRLLEALLQLEGLTVTWSQLDRVLLPARVPGYRSEDLDMLAATGQIVWVGRGAAGPKDGRIALYRRGSPELGVADEESSRAEQPNVSAGVSSNGVAERAPRDAAANDSDVARILLDHLRTRGASFLMELMQALERAGLKLGRDAFESALWDLVWAGEITNDTFAPLRALGGTRAPKRGRGTALAGGRWSRVADLRIEASDTERLLARARILLERYGVVSREAVQAEGIPGGFGPLCRVFKQMEEGGQVRRGYFVEGLSGAQFALNGAIDRLRSARIEETPIEGFGADAVRILAAIDPANPYGALLPWPDLGGGPPPKRISGAYLILVAGKPVLYLGSAGRQLTRFPSSISEEGGELPLALAALHRLPQRGRKRLAIQQIDGLPALESPLREALLHAGFESDYDALVPARGYTTGIGRDPNAVACAGPRR
ncbi:DNA glycosylase AlkZ-like family protein [Thiocapsa marina]|uniref:DEAD/H associated domain protein n=1 Tax=Thiocapsa marina 5811 TaxID=768671 RepID=F9UE46_9GAMM|nr:crosslink repair DNA glycosylase YcaQ family protein [Thiocapsa marina]EGV17603.1 DEAD/H associated domain protein [Thiocapsa marina 5811]